MGKVILVSSGKGGTGKTMFSVNLGALLAEKGYKTILLDMDMGLRNMDLYLGMENKVVYNIMDVMSGICRIKKAMLQICTLWRLPREEMTGISRRFIWRSYATS